jgi:hypothetical protein
MSALCEAEIVSGHPSASLTEVVEFLGQSNCLMKTNALVTLTLIAKFWLG